MPRYVAGLDLGSTTLKLLILDASGAEITVQQVSTPWTPGPGGTTDILATDLAAALQQLILAAAAKLPPNARLEALAVAGMGETGFVIDSSGQALAPGFAWFDPRGQAQAESLPDHLRAEFAGRTGLPWGVQVSVAKILHLRDQGLPLADTQWVNLPEWAVLQLGGTLVGEYSLMSRTGLLDQSTGRPWPELLAHIGIDEGFLPPLVDAGTPLGSATAAWLPAAFRQAALTVAGHDHLVAAVSGGIEPDSYHVSLGTAEVLLRVIDNPLTFDARRRLGDALINCVRHVRSGEYVLVAGVKTGLLMRRVLQLLGITDREGRDQLDARAARLGATKLPAGAIDVGGARNDDGVLRMTVRADGVTPEELFLAVLDHGNDEIRLLMEAMDRELPPPSHAVISGGWTSMASVFHARARVLPSLTKSRQSQETASGAALFARQLTNQEPSPKENQMSELTTADRRALARISTAGGGMMIVAADQRNSMKAVMNHPISAAEISTEELRAAKADLVRHLASQGPAILLDPEVALPHVVDEGTLGQETGLVVGMDASGYDTVDGLRFNNLVAGVTPRTIRDFGGDAAKMLWFLRPDRQSLDSRVGEEMRGLIQACADEGVLLIVEILTYALPGESDEEYAAKFPKLVEDSAAFAVACGAKVLKLAYPGSAEACAAVTQAANGVPWAVLSAGVDHETFVEQVRIAVANGASGAMAGRSLWKDSLAVDSHDRQDLLTVRALPRLLELMTVIDETLAAR